MSSLMNVISIGAKGGSSGVIIPEVFQLGTVVDDGYYNGFLMMSDVVNKAAYGVYKQSQSHVAGGALRLVKTTNNGLSYSNNTITVDGVSVSNSTNHSFLRTTSGRLLISYKVGNTMYFAYSNSNNHVFASTGTPIVSATNLDSYESPIKMIETSYGTIIFAYYVYGTNGNPTSVILMESSDGGLNWTQKCTLFTHSTQATTAPFTDWRGNEIALCETHPTGVAATSKWIAMARVDLPNDGGTYYMFFKSSDGGSTWLMDTTTDSGSFTDDNGIVISSSSFSRGLFYLFLASNSPVDIRLHNGVVYVVNGERNVTYGYALKYITATPDLAFENKFSNWTRHPPLKYYYARIAGSFLDCGYPVFFKDGASLLVGDYDLSNLDTDPSLASRRCLVETVKIV